MGRPPKRKASELEALSTSNVDPVGKGTKKKTRVEETAASSRSLRSTLPSDPAKQSDVTSSVSNTKNKRPGRPRKSSKTSAETENAKANTTGKTGIAVKAKTTTKLDVSNEALSRPSEDDVGSKTAKKSAKKPNAKTQLQEDQEDDDEPSYWLMKAEPESRIEKGKDVKFSIDDLMNATAPEPWDGVRNPVARNNMRTMMKGDLAFFYHSNCKTPGIAGIMEIVEEHSVDESAFDPTNPYHDPKSARDKPKWCVVHVSFRQKFPELIKLSELRTFGRPGGVLEDMQALKMSRLSVSKVSKREWEFIVGLVDAEEVGVQAARYQPVMVQKGGAEEPAMTTTGDDKNEQAGSGVEDNDNDHNDDDDEQKKEKEKDVDSINAEAEGEAEA